MQRMILTIAVSAFGIVGCRSSTYYNAMDTVGYEKREMLTDRVQEARNSQVEARQQLQTALYTLRRVESVPAGQLPELRDDLDSEVGKTKDKIEDLKDDIASVESIAASLFDEWEEDLVKFDSAELREKSRQDLTATKRGYSEMIGALRDTQQRLETVIMPLEDQVLFLDHAANAGQTPRKSEKLDEVREQISGLIEELDDSIDRTERFIEEGVEASA